MMKIQKKKKAVISVLGALIASLCACDEFKGDFGDGFIDLPDSHFKLQFEKTKWISKAGPGGLQQEFYDLGQEDHLMIYHSSLIDKPEFSQWDKGEFAQLRVFLLNPNDIDEAQKSFEVCALNRSWSISATWSRAHPFGSAGKWKNAGGDYDSSLCFPVVQSDETLYGPEAEANELVFDVSAYIEHMLIMAKKDYGLILRVKSSGQDFRIYGEGTALYAPRIVWGFDSDLKESLTRKPEAN